MELPTPLILLIGLVMLCAALVVAAMHRRREHALRDRFAEEYDRTLHEYWRDNRRR